MTRDSRPHSESNAALQFYMAFSTYLKIKLFHEFQFCNKKSVLSTKEGKKYGNIIAQQQHSIAEGNAAFTMRLYN